MRVLIIEDNHSTAKTIELALSKEGIICDRCELGEDAAGFVKHYAFDLIVLDIMLPDINGYEVLRNIRELKHDVPVLILSGLADSEQKIKGLGFGADDYLTKPFNVAELVARVKAIIRRSKGYSGSLIVVHDLCINFDTHTSTMHNKPLHLTCKEQSILELLVLKKNQVITKEHFLAHLYNGIDEPEPKIIDVFVCKMRKKLLEASGGVNYLETVWGRGYALKNPDDLLENQKKLA